MGNGRQRPSLNLFAQVLGAELIEPLARIVHHVGHPGASRTPQLSEGEGNERGW